jgi:hypothetical protein
MTDRQTKKRKVGEFDSSKASFSQPQPDHQTQYDPSQPQQQQYHDHSQQQYDYAAYYAQYAAYYAAYYTGQGMPSDADQLASQTVQPLQYDPSGNYNTIGKQAAVIAATTSAADQKQQQEAAAASSKAPINPARIKIPKEPTITRAAGGQIWDDKTLMEWDPNDFRLFVGDLGNEATDDALKQAFRKYPSFVKAKVVVDKRTQECEGYGFVSFRKAEDYQKAFREMNGKYVAGRPIKLKKSEWKDRNITATAAKKLEKFGFAAMIKNAKGK